MLWSDCPGLGCVLWQKTKTGEKEDGIGAVNGCRISVGGSLTWDDIYHSRSGMVLLNREQFNDCIDAMHL